MPLGCEGQFTDFFFVPSLEITKKSHTKSQEKSQTESTKNHKSLKNYWKITRKKSLGITKITKNHRKKIM